MKLTYVFPITNQKYDLETFFKNFSQEKFFKKYKSWELFFVVDSHNETCKASVEKLAKTNKNIKVIELDKKFNYGTGFKACVPYISGDVTLLGDLEYPNNAQLFEQMIEKYEKGANIVHVKKARKGAKAFFGRLAGSTYNLFVKMFTGRKDALAVTSLQLLDRLVIDVLSTLPDKSNYLRNCVGLEGITTDVVEIDEKDPCYKVDYFVRTTSSLLALVMSIVTVFSMLLLILTNTVGTKNILALNVILIFTTLVSFVAVLITINKHILDVRNDKLRSQHNISKSVNI